MIAPALAIAALLLHAATAMRYGYFRDELYFIACAKRLAWGYADQPPLVAFGAWLAGPFGYPLLALRALPILAAALTVYVTTRLAAELGGGRFAQALAGVATLLAPAYLLLGNTLTTSSLEPLFWTVAIFVAIRIVRGSEEDAALWWLVLGLVMAAGCYAKYSMLLPVVGVLVGLLLTPERRVLRSPFVLYGAAVAAVLLAPNLVWQASHGWPFVEVLRGDAAHRPAFAVGIALEYRNLWQNFKAFAAEQLVYTNPIAAIVWVIGMVALFRLRSLRDLRFVSIGYVVVFVVAVAFAAKGYYIVGYYASLLAIGAVAVERLRVPLRVGVFGLLIAVAIVAMPLSLPVLPIDTLVAYTQRLGLTGRAGTAPHLMQPVFAEEFGWDRLARDVSGVYFSLPPSVRRGAAIYADTYGDAGALDFFGPRYGLPPVISSQNNYYLWGYREYEGATLVAIGATRIDLLRKYYRSIILVRTSTEPYKWIVEGPAPIYLCTDPILPLRRIWPKLRWYGA
ncbi:MAG TPA: glycosyltransferase family 39 protein [Candidatus Baltobacteraceae bacterium]|nr:glycosyltransferase family 39 protein [Candidatus Baltobacteraceae bacterium]